MKRIISVLLIMSIVLVPVTSNALGFMDFIEGLTKKKIESKKRVDRAYYENDLHQEIKKTLNLVNEKAPYMNTKQIRTLKNSLDDRLGNYGKTFKTDKGQLNSIRGRLKNKKLTIEDHEDFQEWLKDIPTNDLSKFDSMEIYKERSKNIPSVIIPPSPGAPTFAVPILVPAL